jgi:hypothetical protein
MSSCRDFDSRDGLPEMATASSGVADAADPLMSILVGKKKGLAPKRGLAIVELERA